MSLYVALFAVKVIYMASVPKSDKEKDRIDLFNTLSKVNLAFRLTPFGAEFLKAL